MLGAMAFQVLISHITYATVVHHAGEKLDDGSVLYAGLLSAGARFVPAGNPIVEAGSALCLKLARRGANEQEIDAAMSGFVAAYLAASSQPSVAWSPVNGNGNARAWSEVVSIIDAAKAPGTISLLDTSAGSTIYYDVDEDVDLKGFVFDSPPGGNVVLRVADGVQLRNGGIKELLLGMFNGGMGALFQSNGTSRSPLAWDTQEDPTRFAPFAFGGGSVLRNDGTVPVINVRANPDGLLVLIAENTASILAGVGPIVHLDPGSNLFLAVNNNGAGGFDPGFVTATTPATNTIGVLSTTGFDFEALAAWVGVAGATFINNPLGMEGGAGPTVNRPIGAIGPLIKGTRYWDVGLAPPRLACWDGAAFVNALGL